MKITIVGGGVIGLSAAWAAVKAGHAVTVIDQGALPNEAGASVDDARLAGAAYARLHGYGHLADSFQTAWDRLWQDLGTSFFRETGILLVSDARPDFGADGAEPDQLDSQALASRFVPFDRLSDGTTGSLSGGGVLAARRTVRELAKWLASNGALLRVDTPVADIDPGSGDCRLADGGHLEGDRLIVAAGAWAPRLLGTQVPLSVCRQVSLMVRVPDVFAGAWSDMPAVLCARPGGAVGMWIPLEDAGLVSYSAGMADIGGGPDGDRLVPRQAREDILAQALSGFRSPDLYDARSGRFCYDGATPDRRFIVRPLSDRAWVMTGFSGHGFMFGPLLGEKIVAALNGSVSADSVSALASGH